MTDKWLNLDLNHPVGRVLQLLILTAPSLILRTPSTFVLWHLFRGKCSLALSLYCDFALWKCLSVELTAAAGFQIRSPQSEIQVEPQFEIRSG